MNDSRIQCYTCKKFKSEDQFHRNSTKRGRVTLCKTCTSEKNKKWRENNLVRSKENIHKFYIKEGVTLRRKIASVVRSAKKKGLEVDLDELERVWNKKSTVCRCCGNNMDFTSGRGIQGMPNTPTFDRVNPILGYVERNIELICFRCNSAKGVSTLDQLKDAGPHYIFIVRYVENHLASL